MIMKKNTFSRLRGQIRKESATEVRKFRAWLLEKLEKGENLSDNWYFKKLFTPAKLRDYENGKLTRKEVILYLVERFTKKIQKESAEAREKIAAATETGGAKEIVVSLVWTPAPTGNICHASVYAISIDNYRYTAEGSAGGYGYDKASAAAAEAFAQLPPVLYHIYRLANAKKEIPYGANYKRLGVPFFDGGVGMECFGRVFKASGLKKMRCFETKKTDLFIFSK